MRIIKFFLFSIFLSPAVWSASSVITELEAKLKKNAAESQSVQKEIEAFQSRLASTEKNIVHYNSRFSEFNVNWLKQIKVAAGRPDTSENTKWLDYFGNPGSHVFELHKRIAEDFSNAILKPGPVQYRDPIAKNNGPLVNRCLNYFNPGAKLLYQIDRQNGLASDYRQKLKDLADKKTSLATEAGRLQAEISAAQQSEKQAYDAAINLIQIRLQFMELLVKSAEGLENIIIKQAELKSLIAQQNPAGSVHSLSVLIEYWTQKAKDSNDPKLIRDVDVLVNEMSDLRKDISEGKQNLQPRLDALMSKLNAELRALPTVFITAFADAYTKNIDLFPAIDQSKANEYRSQMDALKKRITEEKDAFDKRINN